MKTKTKKSTREKKVDKATIETLAAKITDKKKLLYLYPEDCDNLKKRKAFRHTVRRELDKLRNLTFKGTTYSKRKAKRSLKHYKSTVLKS